jgi:hypothetical protein
MFLYELPHCLFGFANFYLWIMFLNEAVKFRGVNPSPVEDRAKVDATTLGEMMNDDAVFAAAESEVVSSGGFELAYSFYGYLYTILAFKIKLT